MQSCKLTCFSFFFVNKNKIFTVNHRSWCNLFHDVNITELQKIITIMRIEWLMRLVSKAFSKKENL